jgi:DNA-binding HxlR family transcriptional regulator
VTDPASLSDPSRAGGNVFDATCPSRRVLDRVADKWVLLVVGCLETGTHRFSQLRNEIGGVSQKMLTQTLRSMERDGLVTRTVYAEVPPRVEYDLTKLGRSLIDAVLPIARWAETHTDAIAASHERFDATHAGATTELA